MLKFLGQPPFKKDPLRVLFDVACNSQAETVRIVSSSVVLPVIDRSELYERKSYRELYEIIEKSFLPNPSMPHTNRLVIIGTSGIGKSAFLVYFIARLLVTSTQPPTVEPLYQHSLGTGRCDAITEVIHV